MKEKAFLKCTEVSYRIIFSILLMTALFGRFTKGMTRFWDDGLDSANEVALIVCIVIFCITMPMAFKLKFGVLGLFVNIVIVIAAIAAMVVCNIKFRKGGAALSIYMICVLALILLVMTIIAMINRRKLSKRLENEGNKDNQENQIEYTKKGVYILSGIIYGVITVILAVLSFVSLQDKGFELEGDTIHVYGNYSCDYWQKLEFEKLDLDWDKDSVVPFGFYDLDESVRVKEISMSDNIESIKNQAFDYFYRVESIDLSDDLEFIGGGAFQQCYMLRELYIPDSVEEIRQTAIPKHVTLKVDAGSYAEQFAIEYGYNYIVID